MRRGGYFKLGNQHEEKAYYIYDLGGDEETSLARESIPSWEIEYKCA